MEPLYSSVPTALEFRRGYKEEYGESPDPEAPAGAAAGRVQTPVEFEVWYTPPTTAPSAADEYAEIKRQLEDSGLFKVTLKSSAWTQYTEAALTDKYPVSQFGWFPDYPDADNYPTPSTTANRSSTDHYSNPEVDKLIDKERATTTQGAPGCRLQEDPAARRRGRPDQSPTSRGSRSRSSATGSTGSRRRSTRRSCSASGSSARTDRAWRPSVAAIRAAGGSAAGAGATTGESAIEAAQGTSLRSYLLTRLALTIPTVLILLTMVFLLMRVAPATRSPRRSEVASPRRSSNAAAPPRDFDRPDPGPVLRVPGGRGHPRPRDHAHRQQSTVTSIISENGAATLELTSSPSPWPSCSGSASGCLRPLPRHLDRRRRADVRDRRLRRAGLLHRLPAPSSCSAASWAGCRRPTGSARSPSSSSTRPPTSISSTRIISGNWRRSGTARASDPAGGDPRAPGQRRPDPPGAGQPVADDAGRLRRGRARARVSERRVILPHAFRNAMVPVVTVAGLQFAILLSGAILTEEDLQLARDRLGAVRYLNNRDYIAVQGIITMFALAVVFVSLLIDVINAFIDPRVRY